MPEATAAAARLIDIIACNSTSVAFKAVATCAVPHSRLRSSLFRSALRTLAGPHRPAAAARLIDAIACRSTVAASKAPPRRRHPSCPSPGRPTAGTRAHDAVPCTAPQALATAAARLIDLLACRGVIGAFKAPRRLLPPGRLPLPPVVLLIRVWPVLVLAEPATTSALRAAPQASPDASAPLVFAACRRTVAACESCAVVLPRPSPSPSVSLPPAPPPSAAVPHNLLVLVGLVMTLPLRAPLLKAPPSTATPRIDTRASAAPRASLPRGRSSSAVQPHRPPTRAHPRLPSRSSAAGRPFGVGVDVAGMRRRRYAARASRGATGGGGAGGGERGAGRGGAGRRGSWEACLGPLMGVQGGACVPRCPGSFRALGGDGGLWDMQESQERGAQSCGMWGRPRLILSRYSHRRYPHRYRRWIIDGAQAPAATYDAVSPRRSSPVVSAPPPLRERVLALVVPPTAAAEPAARSPAAGDGVVSDSPGFPPSTTTPLCRRRPPGLALVVPAKTSRASLALVCLHSTTALASQAGAKRLHVLEVPPPANFVVLFVRLPPPPSISQAIADVFVPVSPLAKGLPTPTPRFAARHCVEQRARSPAAGQNVVASFFRFPAPSSCCRLSPTPARARDPACEAFVACFFSSPTPRSGRRGACVLFFKLSMNVVAGILRLTTPPSDAQADKRLRS
ncbi:hypothetical protein B0H15DRAFT_1019390 [Mycena belliarum]|uniref:Uncharacterized protein n=1 Tax=Mycena belliarum TaxID=1033014 RepID=A0AAD6XW08_9AGAR|nr:hypothetical protein B0H15DRAFT_1019390 [Mycena belliae]